MKSSKTFNNISKKLLSEIPKLKPGQSVVFRMLNGVPNNDPDEKERAKDPILYPKVQLLTQFRLFDPYQNDDQGGYVDVGCVESWHGDNPAAFRTFVTGITPGVPAASRFQGKFELKGGNVRDEELYEIFWLSPQRKGSPCSDASVEVLFEIVDLKGDTKAVITKYDILKKAIDYSKDITIEKAREIMVGLNQPVYQDDDILMAKVKELASSKPDDFIATYESVDTPIKAIVKDALEKGVIVHDFATGEIKMGAVKIAELKTQDAGSFVHEFAKWLNTAANGKDVLNNIKSRMNAKKVQAEATSSK